MQLSWKSGIGFLGPTDGGILDDACHPGGDGLDVMSNETFARLQAWRTWKAFFGVRQRGFGM